MILKWEYFLFFPGRLPLGVTPRNILHASRRRNDGLARVFDDLKLMDREGSGFDLMYDRMLVETNSQDIKLIEHTLDNLLDLAFDEYILILFKKLSRRLF